MLWCKHITVSKLGLICQSNQLKIAISVNLAASVIANYLLIRNFIQELEEFPQMNSHSNFFFFSLTQYFPLLFSGVCWASELSFLMEPSDVIAVRDQPLMLDCRVQGEEPLMVTWRKNGVPLSTSPRFQVLANGTLFIQSFQKRREGSEGDVGEYDCAAQNRYGLLVSRKAKVLLACKCSIYNNNVGHTLCMIHKAWTV